MNTLRVMALYFYEITFNKSIKLTHVSIIIGLVIFFPRAIISKWIVVADEEDAGYAEGVWTDKAEIWDDHK